MRIALLQCDSIVGDVVHNARVIGDCAIDAAQRGANLIVTPELSIVGYPPRDLLLRSGLAEACARASAQLALRMAQAGHGKVALVVGLPVAVDGGARPLCNAVHVLRGGVVEHSYAKRLLPHYDVFDEARYFSAGNAPLVIDVGQRRVGVLICEDFWRGADVQSAESYGEDPLSQTVAAGASLVIVASASPFFVAKQARRLDLLRAAAAHHKISIASVNAVGSNDDFVFDGASALVHADGGACYANRFTPQTLVVDLAERTCPPQPMSADEECARAIISAIGGYVTKTGHQKVLLGLSGGIDSALVATLAVAALGADAVRGVSMPGPFSSRGSVDDAVDLARRLSIAAPDALGIVESYEQITRSIRAAAAFDGLTQENLQSRLRGLTLMTLSNATGALVLSTGNKSELAVGYATLYGDMCGGLAPIGDLLKTQVYSIARWLNANHTALGFAHPPIPAASIEKPPSAELRPDQTDQDSLPPYELLDKLVCAWIDDEQSIDEIVARLGVDRAFVVRWTTAIDRAHYKRFQAPMIPKLSARAFGPGRRMPLAMRYRLGDDSCACGN